MTTNSVGVADGPIAVATRLFHRFRSHTIASWRTQTIQIRDEDALVIALSSSAIPIL